MNVEQIIQGGSVGLALALIGVLYYVLRMLFKVITNHLHDQKKSTDELKETINKNTVVITELVIYLKKANGK